MKQKKLILLSLVLLFSTSLLASGMDDVLVALSKSNAQMITNNFDDQVELNIVELGRANAKQEADNLLIQFYTLNTVKKFALTHRGCQDNAEFAIGTLTTLKTTYRLYVLVKNNKIIQLRIEP